MVFFLGSEKILKKYEIIKKNIDFNDIINTGAYFKNKCYYIYYKVNKMNFPLFGLAVSKKCGNAVVRNKIKRQLRFIIDNNKYLFDSGVSYVIIPRRIINNLSFKEMEDSFIRLLERKESK